jgi:hypothetical protein
MSTDTAWPYDADQHDPLTALRIPVVTSPFPAWHYEVCLFAGGDLWGPALRPDDAEVRQVVAYLGYRMEYYNESWKAKMRKRPLDVDATTNTVILQKRGERDWCYRRASWSTGPLMVPGPDGGHLNLECLLDKINDLVPEKWAAWKAAHPGVFAG